jgi:hypothetical protein
VPFALVGGLAVSVRTEPRFTRDIDLAVSVSQDRDAEALVHSLMGEGFAVLAQIEQEATHRLATIRLAPPSSSPAAGVVVDLLFASSGVEGEVVSAAEPLEVLEGIVVPVSTTAHLLALKVLAQDPRTRPQDTVDARALIQIAGPSDLDQARALLSRIEQAGSHRGKDLSHELSELVASTEPSPSPPDRSR